MSWNVAKVTCPAVSMVLSLLRVLFGSFAIVNLQEVQSWPSHEDESIRNWEWVHLEGSAVATRWPIAVASWVRGVEYASTYPAGGLIVQSCATLLNS